MFGLDFVGGALDDLFTGGKGDSAVNYAGQGAQAFRDLKPIGPSAYESADPATRAAQMDALSQLQNEYRQGGLSAIDRGRVGDIQDAVAQAGRSASASVAQDAMHRGLYNSGNALALQQQAGQGAAMLGAQQGRDAASLAMQQRLAEIGGAGGMATGIRGQDYEKAQAQDAISKFNANNALARAQGLAGVYGHQGDIQYGNANRTSGEMSKLFKAIPGLSSIGGAGDGGASAEDVPGMLGYT